MAKVTVLVPVYNVAPYVEQAIDSILKQTYKDFKILVIDDCSTDNTLDIVRKIKDERIEIVRNEHNLGLAESLNKGIGLIDTEYFARFDGDDIAEKRWLEEAVAFLEKSQDHDICSSGFEWFGTRNGKVLYPEKSEDSMCGMLFGCTVIIPVIRTKFFKDNNLRYRTTAFPAEDYDIWATCYRMTKVYNIQKVMFRYRMHDSQISTAKQQIQKKKSDEVRLRMLEYLNPDISQEDKDYFLNFFAPGVITCEEDITEMKEFVKKIEKYNTLGHYSPKSLHRTLASHVRNAVYNYSNYIYIRKLHNSQLHKVNQKQENTILFNPTSNTNICQVHIAH